MTNRLRKCKVLSAITWLVGCIIPSCCSNLHALMNPSTGMRSSAATKLWFTISTPTARWLLGNGEFAFNFDITGLESFPEYYEKTMPIGILSNWGWHRFPNPSGYSLDKFKMTVIKKHDREFVYPAASTSNPPPEAAYLRANPHRFGLGRIGLEMSHADGSKVAIRGFAEDRTESLIFGVALHRARSKSTIRPCALKLRYIPSAMKWRWLWNRRSSRPVD